jgi:hypothetical protein
MPMELTDYTGAELVAALGAGRILRLAGSIRGKRQTPHAGHGGSAPKSNTNARKPTPCSRCHEIQLSAGAARAHCKGK